MATRTLLSLAEFERLPDDGMNHELDEGEVITVPPPFSRHGKIQAQIAFLLRSWAERAGGTVMSERGPDVAFTRQAVVPDVGWMQGAPDLAVEIVSPSDSAAQIDRKVRQYLAAGAQAVWVVYPGTRSVHVFERGAVRIVDAEQTLENAELLPGFSVPVKAFFE